MRTEGELRAELVRLHQARGRMTAEGKGRSRDAARLDAKASAIAWALEKKGSAGAVDVLALGSEAGRA